MSFYSRWPGDEMVCKQTNGFPRQGKRLYENIYENPHGFKKGIEKSLAHKSGFVGKAMDTLY
jgi:hypothetical protein